MAAAVGTGWGACEVCCDGELDGCDVAATWLALCDEVAALGLAFCDGVSTLELELAVEDAAADEAVLGSGSRV